MVSPLLMVALAALQPVSTRAQDTISAGARIRISTARMSNTAAMLVAASRDSVLIGFSHLPGRPVSFARNEISSLRRSTGRGSERAGPYAAQAGLATGAVFLGLRELRSAGHEDFFAAAAVGAALGVVVGAIIGTASSLEGWLPAEFAPAIDPALPVPEIRRALEMDLRTQLLNDGQAVRFLTADGYCQGSFAGVRDGSVRVAGDAACSVPLQNIREILEPRPVTRTWLKRGAWIGAALSVGYIAIAHASLSEEECGECVPPGAFLIPFGLSGAFAGAVVGGIAGSYVRPWRPQRW